MPRIEWIRTWVKRQSNHGLLAERYRKLQLLIHVMIYLRPISDSGGNCCGYENAELETLKLLVSKIMDSVTVLSPNLRPDSPRIQNRFLVTGISTPLGESLWNYIVLRFFFCELPLSIHSCAKVAWSLGAASLSMTGWDLGCLPTRSGGLRTYLGRQNWHCSPNQKNRLQKSPFQKPPMIKGSFLCSE